MKKDSLILFLLLAAVAIGCNQTVRQGNDNNSNDIGSNTLPPEPEKIEIPDKEKYVIGSNRAGPFVIGEQLPGPATMMKYQMRIEQLTRATDDGIVNEQITIIGEHGKDLVWLKPGLVSVDNSIGNTINEIVIVSPKYKTIEGIGIGSTIAEFRTAYPDHRLWYTYVSDRFVVEADTLKAQFIVDKDDYIGNEIELTSEQVDLSLDQFDQQGKIKRVRMFNYSHNL